MSSTIEQYEEQTGLCRELFLKKSLDYGTSWRVLRIPSLIDQIFIKAQRIRTIEEAETQKISDSINSEYVGIINYSLITLIQLELDSSFSSQMELEKLLILYDKHSQAAKDLMINKNHDYGEAWRQMQVSTFTDLILSKLHRIKQIISNKGQTRVSEGIDANLYDIINYAIFALIRLNYGD